MSGRPRLDELYSLACWEPAEEAEAAAILDTLERERDEWSDMAQRKAFALVAVESARDERDEAQQGVEYALACMAEWQERTGSLEAENAELRRILYAAIDPESGATSAAEVRDLIQGELNAIATTKEVVEREPVMQPADAVCSGSARATGSGGSRSTTSFGADDWATVEAGIAEARRQLWWFIERETGEGWGFTDTDTEVIAEQAMTIQDAVLAPLLAALARLRAADQAKTEALRAAQRFVSVNRVIGGGRPVEAAWDDLVAALAAAAAAPKETT